MRLLTVQKNSFLIDIVWTSMPTIISLAGAGNPCLDQVTRYHCPVFGVVNLRKPMYHIFKRHISLSDKVNYQLLREIVASTMQLEGQNNGNINTYT